MKGSQKPQPETREQASLRMLKDEDSWPQWPRLPLKRWNQGNSSYDVGIVYAGKPTQVRLENLWATKQENDVKCLDYTSPEAVIADGWVVD